MAFDRLTAASQDKKRKADPSVNYRKSDGATRCADCEYWDGQSACQLVAGQIAPDATCDLFEARKPEPASEMEAGEPPQGATSASSAMPPR